MVRIRHFQVEDYLPGDWLSPMLDGSNVEGKFKTRKGLVAMKKGNLQVTSLDGCIDANDDF